MSDQIDYAGRPPLWSAIEQAVINAPQPRRNVAGSLYAAQIRAMRDYIRMHVPGYGWQPWQVRQIADLLTAEAERAEAGHE